MKLLLRVLQTLTDGQPHSGEAIAIACNVSRTAVWKCIAELRKQGHAVTSKVGSGYQLQQPLQLLSLVQIQSCLSAALENLAITLLPTVTSTNQYLLDRLDEPAPQFCLAEQQTAGRGRRGNVWHSPYGANLYLSCSWRFSNSMSKLQGLSLYVAAVIVDTLQQVAPANYKIKWPNDIYCEQKKLAGILIELTGDLLGPTHVVIGIGVNVTMPQSLLAENAKWTDLASHQSEVPTRNQLAALLITNMYEALSKFEQIGLADLAPRWPALDLLWQQPISYNEAGVTKRGVAKGIDVYGQLLVADGSILTTLQSGEVHSLRSNGEREL